MFRPVSCLALVLLSPLAALAGDWLAWRGPLGTGISDEKNVPLKWSKEENVKWRVALDGPGNSTPIVVGDKVFLAHPPASNKKSRSLICFDRQTGKELWKHEAEYAEEEKTHGTNPYCSSSPVSDGKHVYVFLGPAGLFALDLDGNLLWKRDDLEKVDHFWGIGSSPMLYGDLLILNLGPGTKACVVALNKSDGKDVWRRDFPGMQSKTTEEYRASWSTPVLHDEGNGRTTLLLSLPETLWAIDPKTGEDVWSCQGLKALVYTSPLCAKDVAVAMGGFGGPALAARAGNGDVTEKNRLWHHPSNPQRIGSGVIVGDHIYMVNENGAMWCLELETGKRLWEERLEQSGGQTWGSLSYADGRLYILTLSGMTYVIEANPSQCKILAENDVGERTRSSLAFSDGQVFVRTHQALWCIEEKK
ncbi:MAG TPA: PQQ-binding-like beta-propeller repeat protein [Pirellulaceae bacterium]|nr:PQQ-binding-like beta-propeller repeat protein [Pirellulaceae bacterium]